MRPFVERLVSFLTLLLAAFAMAQLASAQTLPDSRAPQDQITDSQQHLSYADLPEARLELPVADEGGWR